MYRIQKAIILPDRKNRKLILLRYFNRELINMTMIVFFVLLSIIVSNMFVRCITILSISNIESTEILKVILVTLPKHIAYLLPISFFFSILLTYGKLFSNNELTIFFACGNSWLQCLKIIIFPAITLCIIEIFLTLFILPKMDQSRFLLQKIASKKSLISFIQPGKIIPFNEGRQAIYITSINNNNIMHDIFMVQLKNNNMRIIVTASAGYSSTTANGTQQFLILKDGYYYEVIPGDLVIQKGSFKNISLFFLKETFFGKNTSIESIPTKFLFKKNDVKYKVELQWRLSFPLSVLIATLIALTFCKVRPQQNRYSKIIPAILFFIIYFNVLSLSKLLTNQGLLPLWVGLWWVHLLFGFVMLVILKKYNGPIKI